METYPGTYTAQVVEVDDPTGQSRVRLVVPQVHGTASTTWARPASGGTCRVGDLVMMAYAGGDPNYPVYWPGRSVVTSVNGQVGDADVVVLAGGGTVVAGAGSVAVPYVVAAALSADGGNGLMLGSDQGLYARAPQTGSVSMTVASTTLGTSAVVFPRAYSAAPVVMVNFSSGAGPTAGWGSRAINVTATGFSIFIFGTSSSFTVSMQWLAFPTPF